MSRSLDDVEVADNTPASTPGEAPAASPAVAPEPKARAATAPRSLALDAMRGLAILLMCVSGLTPRFLPNFMYHGNNAQYQPVAAEHGAGDDADAPATAWEPIGQGWTYDSSRAGMTWVDVVFPMFLFAMGAAIPLAHAARLRRDPSRWRQVRSALSRFGVLVLFAVYVQQVAPSLIDASPTDATLWMAVLAFVVLIPLLTRLPRDTPVFVRRLMRLTGAVGAVVMLCVINTRPSHAGFDWATHDIIILLLAWNSLAASLLWLATPGRPRLRLSLGFALALVAHEINLPPDLRLGGAALWAGLESLLQMPGQWLDFRWLPALFSQGTPSEHYDLSGLYGFGFLACLWLVLPGMMVGQRLVAQAPTPSPASAEPSTTPAEPPAPTRGTTWALVVLLLSVGAVVVLAGLQDVVMHWDIGPIRLVNPYTALLGLVPVVLAWGVLLSRKGRRVSHEALVQYVVGLGVLSLVVGVVLSVLPGLGGAGDADGFLEGGVRKVPGTLSWYFTSNGLICLMLAVLIIAIDLGRWRRAFGVLIGSGQNPVLAYVASRNLLWPLASLPLIGWLGGPASIDGLVYGQFSQWTGMDLSAWWELAWGLVKIAALACLIWALTRAKVLWRV